MELEYVLILLFVPVALIITWVVFRRAFGRGESGVDAVAKSIAEFDLPAGYRPDYTFRLPTLHVAGYKSSDGRGHLLITQTSGRDADFKEHTRRYQGRRLGILNLTPVHSETRLVRGQEAQLVLSEGKSSRGEPYHTATLRFAGKLGPTILSLAAPSGQWDIETLNRIIASIR